MGLRLRLSLRTHGLADLAWPNPRPLMEPKDPTGYMGIYHNLLSTPPVGVLRRKPSVATTTRPRARSTSNYSCAYAHRDQPGTDLRPAPAAGTYHAPAPPSPTVGKQVSPLQQTGITPLVARFKHIAKALQPTLPPVIHHGQFYMHGGHRDRLGATTPGLGVALAHLRCWSRARRCFRRRTGRARHAQLESDAQRECVAHVHVPLCVARRDLGRRRQCCPQW